MKKITKKMVEDYLYELSNRGLIDHLDCWLESDWAFATKKLKDALEGEK